VKGRLAKLSLRGITMSRKKKVTRVIDGDTLEFEGSNKNNIALLKDGDN